MGSIPPMTPAHTADDLLGGHELSAPTPHHSGIDANLPPEPLENLQHDLPAMENMGYDQVDYFEILQWFQNFCHISTWVSGF